jgi:hypothetical protein
MTKEKVVVQAQGEQKAVAIEEFEKRVEIEAANLMYFEYMRKEKAFEQARAYIESKFVVAK